jgi:multidrug efflux pump subunit AcrA (membrane-fusion protein)
VSESTQPRVGSLGSTIKQHWVIAIIVAVILVLCIGLLFRVLAKPKAKPAAPPPIPIAAAAVKAGSIDIYLDALGTVTPVYTVTVASRVAGELTQVRFKEGQIVKKNELWRWWIRAPIPRHCYKPRDNSRATMPP